MTHQDFNHIYVKFTGNKKGIKSSQHITTTAEELKEFVEFALKTNSLLSNQKQSKLQF
ncbi:MAG: hypothetical protein JXR05_04335 [Flavobacteriaceae bacterium]